MEKQQSWNKKLGSASPSLCVIYQVIVLRWCRARYRTQEECKNTSLPFKDSPSTGGHSQLSRLEGRASPCDLHVLVPLKSSSGVRWCVQC